MRISLDKLRWVLAIGSVGLVVILAVFVGYGRFKAARLWQDHLKRLGVHIEKTTDGFTYSQTKQGRTIFTLHAAKAIQHDEGKYTLHDVAITLYGQGRTDHIYGNQFEYDDKDGVAKAVGDVQMDLQAPRAYSKNQPHGEASSTDEAAAPGSNTHDIHVRTSGLVYVKKLGVAATQELVEFNYLGLDCTSQGAEFNTNESIVHLLADVELHGNVKGRALTLHAAKADLDRNDNTATLQTPVLESQGERAQADHAVFHLRTDGSVEAAEATGSVTFQKGTQRITAASANGIFDKDDHPQHAKLTGNVVIDNTDPARLLHGGAEEAEAQFDPLGEPEHMTATGGAHLEAHSQAKNGAILSRTMRGNRLEAAFKPGRAKSPSLTDVHVIGNALTTGESPASPTGTKTTQIAADDLRAAFVPDTGKSPEIRQVWGEGNTRLQQDAPLGEQQVSTGDHLQILFAPSAGGSTMQVASATQTGHVQIHSEGATRPGAAAPEPVVAGADKSVYEGQSGKLTLTGSARFLQGDTSVAANTVVVDQQTGDSDAAGDVLATFSNSQQSSANNAQKAGGSNGAQQANAQAAHVRSSTAHLQHALQIAQFHGSDAQPVRLWQGASQVEAAILLLDGQKHTLAARPEHAGGLVHAVFAGQQAAATVSATKKAVTSGGNNDHITRVAANAMDYDDITRAASFGGSVHVDSSDAQAQSQHAVAFLAPVQRQPANTAPAKTVDGLTASMSGSLQKIVMWGDVYVEQPGREGRGERLVYTAADQSFLLTGTPSKPPQVVDSRQGNVTGAALLFKSSDSSMIVSGASGNEHGRVRTETGAKQ